MKVIAYCALHYGSCYLGWAIRSVIDYIDELWVLYSPTGSHGHGTELVNPDHPADLYEIAKSAAGDKLHWYSASPYQWKMEGEQREYIHQCVPDVDVILVLDADEVWSDGLAEFAIDATTSAGFHEWRLPMVHYWRSFNRCITDDAAYPIRVICPKRAKGEAVYLEAAQYINHLGYAQRSEIVEYKQHTHGHKGEWRSDWYQTKWLPNAQTDVHPTNIDYWNPVAVDWRAYMPAWMAEHPYSELDIIP